MLPPINENSPFTYMLAVAVGGLFLALMKVVNDAIKDAREGEREARQETAASRAEAKADREAMRAEVVEGIKRLDTAQQAMAEAQEAQYLISDGLVRTFRESNDLPAPERPPPSRRRAGTGG